MQVNRVLPRLLRNADAAAEVQDARFRIICRARRENPGRFEPALEIEVAAAAVRVEPDHACASRRDRIRQLVELLGRNSKLRMEPAGSDFLVVAESARGVEPQEDLASCEQRSPGAQHIKVVDRNPESPLERPAVLLAWREVRREQDPFAGKARYCLEGTLDLGARHALESAAGQIDRAKDFRMGIRLQGIQDPGNRLDAAQLRVHWHRWSQGRRRRRIRARQAVREARCAWSATMAYRHLRSSESSWTPARQNKRPQPRRIAAFHRHRLLRCGWLKLRRRR